MSDSELRQARLSKVQAMREANVEPYAYTYDRPHSSGQLHDLYQESWREVKRMKLPTLL